MRKTVALGLLTFLLVITITSCKQDDLIPPDQRSQLSLSLEDVSCIEAWIKLTTTNISLPADVELFRDSSITKTLTLPTADTLLYVDSLLPNHSYNFHTIIHPYNHTSRLTSSLLPVTTMDTTSHSFTWRSWTFGGQAGSCTFRDVNVINENDIWAVGEIYLLDTLGQPDPNAYNAVHWDGNDWQLLRLQFYTFCGQPHTGSYPARSIIAFGENDIWITSGSQITHSDGINQISTECIPVSVNKLWGTGDNDMYAVGQIGKIAHNQNGQWSSIESGTDMPLADMAGTSDDNIFICGLDINNVTGIILKKNNPGWETFVNSGIVSPQELFNPDLYGSISGLWIDEKNTLYAAGNLLFCYKLGKWDYVHTLPENFIGGNPGTYYRGYIVDVKGVKSNDMWIVGDRNTLRHFNGMTWNQVGMPYSPDGDIVWIAVFPKDNIVAVVGSKGNSAIVMLIKR